MEGVGGVWGAAGVVGIGALMIRGYGTVAVVGFLGFGLDLAQRAERIRPSFQTGLTGFSGYFFEFLARISRMTRFGFVVVLRIQAPELLRANNPSEGDDEGDIRK